MMVTIILAAGKSSRMGRHKMLLPYKGKTLLQHIIDEVKMLTNNALVVVTGKAHLLTAPALATQGIAFVKNIHWETGMGSSVSTGMNYILEHFPATENVLILTCDQPFITTALLQQMLSTKAATAKGIVACSYAGTSGVPVLFDKKYMELLLSLKGDIGAKKIIAGLMDDVAVVDFPEGAIDIDEPEDYKKLIADIKI